MPVKSEHELQLDDGPSFGWRWRWWKVRTSALLIRRSQIFYFCSLSPVFFHPLALPPLNPPLPMMQLCLWTCCAAACQRRRWVSAICVRDLPNAAASARHQSRLRQPPPVPVHRIFSAASEELFCCLCLYVFLVFFSYLNLLLKVKIEKYIKNK